MKYFHEILEEGRRLKGCGLIEEKLDESSQLTIFNYTQHHHSTKMFRGLVLHIPSETVVATPFVRFTHFDIEEEEDVLSYMTHLFNLTDDPAGTLSNCILYFKYVSYNLR